MLLVGTAAGYAVIVQGRIANNEGLASHNKSANRIYETLIERGFADANIFYFNHDASQPGVDGLPVEADVRAAIEGLASLVNVNPAPIYLAMVDHGASDNRFLLNPTESIAASELDGWLDTLESNLNAAALAEPRVVVVGTCYSGGVIPVLSGPNRLIVASAAADEESYKGPIEADGIRVGEFFLEEFFQELGRGETFLDAFRRATATTERYTRRGGGGGRGAANRYFDAAEQHPLLDDDGDGVGSNVLDVTSSDGAIAASLILGTGPNYDVNSGAKPADIVSVTETLFLANTESTAALHLFANDPAQVSQAYVEIRSPVTVLAPEGGTEQLSTDYTRRQMLPPGGQGNPFTDRFHLNHAGFVETGKYEIYYYVEDVETADISPSRRSVVYKNLGANQAPGAFELLSPAAGATVKTVRLFDWEDALDPDGHALGYSLLIADDAGFTTFNGAPGAYRQDELAASIAVVDGAAGLRVRPETLCRITEFSEHESNGRELDEGERVAVEVLPVLGQSAAAVEPGDGAFDHPTPGLDDEALHPIGSLDDLGLEIGQDAGQGAVKDRPLIGAVGEQFPEKGKQTEQGRQQRETAVAILNVGGGDDAVQQQALRIDQNMPLLALDQLAGIEAVAVDASPPFSALFTL